jgi:hypothetical protein
MFLEIRYVMFDTKFHFFLLTRYFFTHLLTVSLRNCGSKIDVACNSEYYFETSKLRHNIQFPI